MKKTLHLHFWTVIIAACAIAASCSEDQSSSLDSENASTSNVGAPLKFYTGSSQQERIISSTRADIDNSPKQHAIQCEAIIKAPLSMAENKWSATGIVVNQGKAYVSWHSNFDYNNVSRYGGFLDILDLSSLSFNAAYSSDHLKFNDIYILGDTVYSAATGLRISKTDPAKYIEDVRAEVLAMSRSKLITGSDDIIPQEYRVPGSSCNSITRYYNHITSSYDNYVYVSCGNTPGWEGAVPVSFVTLSAEANNETNYYGSATYYADDASADAVADAFGETPGYYVGKYVSYVEDDILSFYQTGRTQQGTAKAYIRYGDTSATPALCDAVIYTASDTHEDDLDGTYGKFVCVSDLKYVYACFGDAGIRIYKLEDVKNGGTLTAVNNIPTRCGAVAVDDKYIYAATAVGLRIYSKADINENGGVLSPVALEGEKTVDGSIEGYVPAEGSCNYIALYKDYILVAYGQQGVKIFRFNPTKIDRSYEEEYTKVTVTPENISSVDWNLDRVIYKFTGTFTEKITVDAGPGLTQIYDGTDAVTNIPYTVNNRSNKDKLTFYFGNSEFKTYAPSYFTDYFSESTGDYTIRNFKTDEIEVFGNPKVTIQGNDLTYLFLQVYNADIDIDDNVIVNNGDKHVDDSGSVSKFAIYLKACHYNLSFTNNHVVGKLGNAFGIYGHDDQYYIKAYAENMNGTVNVISRFANNDFTLSDDEEEISRAIKIWNDCTFYGTNNPVYMVLNGTAFTGLSQAAKEFVRMALSTHNNNNFYMPVKVSTKEGAYKIFGFDSYNCNSVEEF